MREFYSSEITDPSLEELRELARWYNEKLGNYPIIVGGSATYLYTGGLGSKDIDVVFPDDRSKDATLSLYFASHGYTEKKTSLFDKELVKSVKAGKREVEIIVDAVSAKRIIRIKNGKVAIPWNWAPKNCVEKNIGKATVYVPTIVARIHTRSVQFLAGNELLRQESDPAQLQYFRSKVWKDVYDAVSLSKFEIDLKKIGVFFNESGMDKYRDEIAQIIDDNYDAEMRGLLSEVPISRIKMIVVP